MKRVLSGLLALSLAVIIAGCAKHGEPPAETKAKKENVPVTVAEAVLKNVPIEINATGSVEAFNSLTITSRVAGQIQKIHFSEGQYIKQGDTLVSIDPRDLQEKLRQAEAKLAEDQSRLKFNVIEAQRYEGLFQKEAVSKSEAEKNKLSASTQAEIVESDKAQVRDVKNKLSFTTIVAPIEGRTGEYLINEGAIVSEQTKLLVIKQITPIYVKFSVPEKYIADIKKHSANHTLKVVTRIPDKPDEFREGSLTFVDNTVNQETGMILMKGTIPNDDKYLWPGQFVNVTLILGEEQNAVVVPAQAVQVSQTGDFVFVVKPDKTVVHKSVTVARKVGGESIIADGIQAGDIVVTDGQIKLKDGFPVDIRNPQSGKDAAAPKPSEKTEPAGK